MQPYNAVTGQLKELFSGGLLTTTLLLQFIWFTNALAYYGLVLLATSVSSRSLIHPGLWLFGSTSRCMPDLSANVHAQSQHG